MRISGPAIIGKLFVAQIADGTELGLQCLDTLLEFYFLEIGSDLLVGLATS